MLPSMIAKSALSDKMLWKCATVPCNTISIDKFASTKPVSLLIVNRY
jgi:hypothetical protein